MKTLPRITNPEAGVWRCVETPVQHEDSPTLVSMWPVRPYHHQPSVACLKAYSWAGQNMLRRPPPGGYF